ncbi:MAG: GNAT family N-acetyltransferase [Gemmatimonadaceae bacterium]|nr:GNAT family N-acetyltransferase [Gemmatimonadaceae bacterium]
MLHEWLSRPHVSEWWDGTPTFAGVVADFTPSIRGGVAHWCYIVMADGAPLGFIQAYSPVAFHDDGWWLDEHDPGVRGIDQFLAESALLGRGLGSAMVRAFVAKLFADPAITRIQTDPEPGNGRAIRCYEKAGFRAAGEIDTKDGPALLMYCERPVGESFPSIA